MTEETQTSQHETSGGAGTEASSHYPRNHPDTIEGRSAGSNFLIILGIVLVVIGALTLLPTVFAPVWAPVQAAFSFAMSFFWPAILIAAGFFLIKLATNSSHKTGETDMNFVPSMPAQGTRLLRSRKNRMITGVCGGIGEYFNVDPTVIRLITILLFFIPGAPIIIAYLVAWIIIPLDRR